MSGVRAVLWKELRETYAGGGRPVASVIVSAILALLVAVGVPLFMALLFSHDQAVAYSFAVATAISAFGTFLGFFSPMPTIVDTFAGERERHTLETLLATPLSDRAILGGKVLAQYIPVWGSALLLTVASAATATAVAGGPGLLVLPLALVGTLVGGTVTATFIVGLGSLISLGAPTIKKGQERLSLVMLPIFMLPALSGAILPRIVQEGGVREVLLASVLVSAGLPILVLGLAAVFMTLLFARFRRDRLIGR